MRGRLNTSIVAGVLLVAPLLVHGQGAAVYQIRPSPQGRFALEVFKTGMYSGKKHLFLFQKYTGSVRFDPASPGNSSVQLTLEGASAACQDTWVNKSDLQKIQDMALEMMDVAKHPQLVFTSQRVVGAGPNKFEVHGSLSIRGLAKPVTVLVSLERQGEEALVFNGSAQVRLKDYGLKPPGAALGLIGTRDDMHIEFALRGTREK